MMKSIILFFVDVLVRMHVLTPIRVARLKFFYKLHRWPDFEHPKDLNEKINWMKFYGDTSHWPLLADKYRVREYVKACGLEDCLVPLIGKWDTVEEIDWDALPRQFVMKCNNGSGDVVICKDKKDLDRKKTVRHFQKQLNKRYGILTGETHYSLIKPCILAEELLGASSQAGEPYSLVDYKIWCFNGKPAYVVCYSKRHKSYYCEIGVYDLDWNSHPETLRYSSHYIKERTETAKPKCFDQMLQIASKLSTGFPQVRVDLYEVGKHIYFSELTFTSSGGYMAHFTPSFLKELGDLILLP